MTTRPDILLANSFFLCEDAGEQRVMKPYPPLGLLYLSAYLKRRGFGVEVFDATFQTPGDFARAIEDARPLAIGISCNLGTRQHALRMIRESRQRGILTIIGGPEPANYIDEYLGSGADCVVLGEGEMTLEALLYRLREGRRDDWGSIDGIAFSDGSSSVIRNPPRQPIENLSSLPWPDRGAVDIRRYLSAWRGRHGYGPVSLICARGCPYRCRWCSHSTFGRTHRRRTPTDVADEVQQIRTTYDPDALWYADDVYNIDPRWLYAFRDKMVERSLPLPFECICRADRMNPQVVEALVDLKCTRVWIGAESGSQRILDAMQRGVKIEQVRRAARMAGSAGIEVGTFIMLGYEGETLADIEATVDHLATMAPDVALTTLAYPIKGTEYHEAVADRITADGPWAGRTDRDLRVSGKHPREFYELANRWVCAEIALLPGRRQRAQNPLATARRRLRAKWYRHRTRRFGRRIESADSRKRPANAADGAGDARDGSAGRNAAGMSAGPFDAIAPEYDEGFTDTDLGRWLRRRVWERLADVIPPGSEVLDLGGGTAEDACWLAARGARVTCTDGSDRMLDIASRKAATAGLSGQVTFARLNLNALPSNGEIAGPFDAALANFGAMNCVTDRRALASWLAMRTAPGAPVVLTVMGPLCPWEHIALALTDPASCLRRWRPDGVKFGVEQPACVRVQYPSPARLAAEFAPWFGRVRLTGLGVLLPPTRWRSIVEQRPRLFRSLRRMERAIAHRWPFTWLNDHYVLELRRRG